jgi:hypothetical protein
MALQDGVESSSLQVDQHAKASEETSTLEQQQNSSERAPLVSHVPPPASAANNDRTVPETPDSGLITQEEEVYRSARKPLNFLSAMAAGGAETDEDSIVNADNDDDDDDSSLSSALSSDEEEDEEETLLEKAARNRVRNALFLRNLNAKYKGEIPEVRTKKKEVEEYEEEDDGENSVEETDVAPKGMLQKQRLMSSRIVEESSSYNLPERIKHLLERYPGREPQIRRLTSLLLSTIGQLQKQSKDEDTPFINTTTTTSVHVPAPLLVVGPRGTGKTSVVCDVVQSLKSHEKMQQSSSPVGYAYINCGTLDPYSIERLVANAYNQLRPEEYVRFKKRRRKQLRMRKRKRKVEELSQETTNPDEPSKDEAQQSVSSPAGDHQVPDLAGSPDPMDIGASQSVSESENINTSNDPTESAADRRVQPRRTVKALSHAVENSTRPTSTMAPKNNVVGTRAAGDSVEITHSAVIAFGRALNPFYGEGSNRCAMLVVDNGERLLTLSTRRSSKGKTNFLAELLLLPKVMRLNLTIVVITRYSTIAGTRKFNIGCMRLHRFHH